MTLYLCLLSLILTPVVISQTVNVTPPSPRINQFVTGDCTVNSSSLPVWSVSMSGNDFINISELQIYELSNSSTADNVTVSWRVQFQFNTAGTYRCQYTLNGMLMNETIVVSTGIIASNFEKDVEVYRGIPRFEIECRFQIAPPPSLPRANWCYQPYVFPSLGENCIPIANNSKVIPIQSFPNFTATNIYVSSIEISSVLATNAGLYRCVILSGDSNFTGDVRVRVRDQLDPLWPAVGIMIQLVIVTIVIAFHFVWDYYKEKKNLKMRQNKEEQNIVTTPTEDLVEDDQLSNQNLINVVPK